MPSSPAKAAHDLGDFADFLRQLIESGFEFTVIGGCAVTTYARLLGKELYSHDLDIYVTHETLAELLNWAPRNGIRVVKRPRPRNLAVAFFETDGKEVDALASTSGLPEPEVVARTARQIVLSAHGDLEVPVADPFDLLGNKLAVRRDKDLPHIDVLREFAEAEAVAAFSEEHKPRARLAPARRLLDVLGIRVLPAPLAGRLIELAKTPVDMRFLMGRVPTAEQAERLMKLVDRREAELQDELAAILAQRRFEDVGRKSA